MKKMKISRKVTHHVQLRYLSCTYNFLFFNNSTHFTIQQGEKNSHAESKDCMIIGECAEEQNEKNARTPEKKNVDSTIKRKVSSKKENVVSANLSDDRPKRIRKTPDRFTY